MVGNIFAYMLNFLKERNIMALKIKTREEAIAVLRDMVQRKKAWEAEVQKEFVRAREKAMNCYESL